MEDDKRLTIGVLKTIHYDKYGNVQSIDLGPDSDMEIIKLTDATEDDIDCYYEHLMKEHYVAYDEEELDKFYKERPGIHRYNKLVWAFKSTGLKAGDYLDYAMPEDIRKEEAKFEDKLAKALEEAQYD